MCGIAGSPNREKAFALYEANLVRGRYSAGMLTDHNGIPEVFKSAEPIVESEVPQNRGMYLFHSCAPTGRTVEYRPINTHPFRVDGVYVAHNGIISNAAALASEYDIDYSDPAASLVDSYVIPYIITCKRKPDVDWPSEAILLALPELVGTFGLWIYVYDQHRGSKTYVCRSGSTLYLDKKTCDFSSSLQPGYTLIPDGKLFELTYGGAIEVGTFKTKPTYYIAP